MKTNKHIHPTLVLFGKELPTFLLLGIIGFVTSVCVGICLTLRSSLPLYPSLVLVAGAVVTFLLVAFGTKVIKGQEALIYYHHEMAIVLTSFLLLRWIKEPALPYMDIVVIGIGTLLAFGRVGCTMAGCCHGRPYKFGVWYDGRFIQRGVDQGYIGLRLFPIQLVESAWVFITVTVCIAVLWSRAIPGTAFVCYVILYDTGRFCFEFLRGDAGRPYYMSFSEAQWISLIVDWTVIVLGVDGALPIQGWHVVLVSMVTAIAVSAYFYRRIIYRGGQFLLLPVHLMEVARVIREYPMVDGGDNIKVCKTSRGLNISCSIIDQKVMQVTLSDDRQLMNLKVVRVLSLFIKNIRGTYSRMNLVKGRNEIYHLIFTSP